MDDTAQLLKGLINGIASRSIKVVDLTCTLTPQSPVIKLPDEFAQCPKFEIWEISNFDDNGPFWYWNAFKTSEHTGTHFDAPIHWITGKDHEDGATDTIPVEHFVAPACVIDVERDAQKDPDFLLTVDRIKEWEADNGEIPAGAWVLLRSGWSARQDDEDDYLNMDEQGAHTPGPAPEAVDFLINERDVLGFGTETVGTDAGQGPTFDTPFPCHAGMHGANKFGLASLTNLDLLPPTGAVVIAAPLKIQKGSGSPVRALALVPV